ncbi:MAG: TrmH family RNA methyltransferase [Fibrobacterota bacterium]
MNKKEILSLRYKKYRKKYGLFLLEGDKFIRDAIRKGFKPLVLISINSDTQFRDAADGFHLFNKKDFSLLSSTITPQKNIAVFKIPDPAQTNKIDKSPLNLYLDGISDPGNLGTILRSAAAFNTGAVYIGKECAEVYSPKTVRSSAGALLDINIIPGSPETVLEASKKGRSVLAASATGKITLNEDLRKDIKRLIIIGSEGKGVTKALTDLSDGEIKIPHEKNTESLNAAAAASVIMAHYYFNGLS